MNPSLFITVLLVIITFSCKQRPVSEAVENNDTPVITGDSIVPENDTIASLFFTNGSQQVAFQGNFPCTDCELVQTILFNNDHTFQEQHQQTGSHAITRKSYGNWSIKDEKIYLTEENKSPIVLRFLDDTLYAINIHNVRVADSSKYKLSRQTLAVYNSGLQPLRAQGVDFLGRGNEPFWSVQIENGKLLKFKLADWEMPLVAVLDSYSETVDSTVYKLHSKEKKWTVTVYPQFCRDGMSDLLYQYKVQVRYNGTTYKGCGIMLN